MANDMNAARQSAATEIEPEYAPEEIWRQAERFLYREARLLDNEHLQQWLSEMVDKSVRYLIVTCELRYRKERRYQAGAIEAYIYDDNYTFLETRVNQFHSGNQWRADPAERYRRLVTNIEVFVSDRPDEFLVRSNCFAQRARRAYEVDTFVYCREDILSKRGDGPMKLLSRRIDFDERSVGGRNMAMFY